MKKLLILGIILLITGVLALGWWNNAQQPVNPDSTESTIFVVPKGVSIRELGNSLKKEGLIKDPVVFFLYVKKEGLDKKIQAGDFRLSPSMSLSRIVEEMQHGSLDKWVTIPEGWRAEQIAERLEGEFPQYDDSWEEQLKLNEGYLYPDTYLIPRDATIETIVSLLTATFQTKIAEAGISSSSPQLQDAVVMASLIEREAKTDEEKPLIASVMYNRIEEGMSLDIDATLQYMVGKKNDKWWYPPTGEEKSIDSPYNTYKNIGLPPQPICNPSITSIQAALNPAKSDYFFYIHEPSGQVHFAKTNDEHNANVRKYLQ